MRSVLKTSGRKWNLGWLLPLVLLALPNCLLSGGAFDPDPNAPNFSPGPDPTSAIMCEIPVPVEEGDEECATAEEVLVGIPFEAAATALATSQANPIMLDFSDAAKEACPETGARKKTFYGTWPDGVRVCLNCGIIPNLYASPVDVCVAKCMDLLDADEELLDYSNSHVAQQAFCLANARVAINVEPETICYEGACNADGTENSAWVDPRRTPEPVKWTDHIGTTDNGGTNELERSAPTTGGNTEDFNAGAASIQTTAKGKNGDGWVEFSAAADIAGNATDKVHVLGLRASFTSAGEKCFDVSKCQDTDAHIETVGFAIDLNSDGRVYVLEPDPTGATPFLVSQPFDPPYTEGERFRIKFKDNRDGTAAISYARMDCSSGTCVEVVFMESSGNFPLYPLRVDTTFREQGAKINNVTIVRIK